jgi:hypothetical protein
MTLEDTKQILVGEWVSLTPEVRPSATRNPGGTLKAFYLSLCGYPRQGGNFMEYAGNVDGRGCDTEQNRPTNLQIPLRRKG